MLVHSIIIIIIIIINKVFLHKINLLCTTTEDIQCVYHHSYTDQTLSEKALEEPLRGNKNTPPHKPNQLFSYISYRINTTNLKEIFLYGSLAQSLKY